MIMTRNSRKKSRKLRNPTSRRPRAPLRPSVWSCSALSEKRAVSDPEKKAEMVARSGGKATFPQIFINGQHVGGSDDIHALDRKGGLDPLLAA